MKNIIIVTFLVILAGGIVCFLAGDKSAPSSDNKIILPSNKETFLSSEEAKNTNMNKNTNVTELKIETLQEGEGEGAKNGDSLTVNYTGTLMDGTKFDSSYDRNAPFVFTLGQGRVIQGWELGLVGMKKGEERKLTIPSRLGYGESGAGNAIPPNADLIFTITLLEIN